MILEMDSGEVKRHVATCCQFTINVILKNMNIYIMTETIFISYTVKICTVSPCIVTKLFLERMQLLICKSDERTDTTNSVS